MEDDSSLAGGRHTDPPSDHQGTPPPLPIRSLQAEDFGLVITGCSDCEGRLPAGVEEESMRG